MCGYSVSQAPIALTGSHAGLNKHSLIPVLAAAHVAHYAIAFHNIIRHNDNSIIRYDAENSSSI